jgi:hypothetical protein
VLGAFAALQRSQAPDRQPQQALMHVSPRPGHVSSRDSVAWDGRSCANGVVPRASLQASCQSGSRRSTR